MARKSPEINASSMADIAFLLLIFFLVTTTMSVDSGIQRTLPPIADNEQDDKGVDVKQGNLFFVHINLNNQVAANGELISINDLKEKAKEFIVNPLNNPFPEKEKPKEAIQFFPDVMISKGVISLQNDVGTTYESYIHVQNELTKAFNEARNDLAVQNFGKKYSEISPEQKAAVNKVIPLRISEAEPRNVKR